MKLYVTPTSPYARIALVVVLEKGLESRIEVVTAQTRRTDSSYYRINPSGRVPYLVRDDGVGLEDSALICAYLDHLDREPVFDPPAGDPGWETRRLESLARGLLDGLAVWGRELKRPRDERSPTILAHEARRSERLADLWEDEVDHPLMRGPLNLAQVALTCALGLEALNSELRWRAGHPRLSEWFERVSARPSLAATAPPDARGETARAQRVWAQIHAVLERERDRIYAEIQSYPPPIPACDEQFNHLLDQRARVSRELARMKRTDPAGPSLAACRHLLDELAADSSLIPADAERELRSRLVEP